MAEIMLFISKPSLKAHHGAGGVMSERGGGSTITYPAAGLNIRKSHSSSCEIAHAAEIFNDNRFIMLIAAISAASSASDVAANNIA